MRAVALLRDSPLFYLYVKLSLYLIAVITVKDRLHSSGNKLVYLRRASADEFIGIKLGKYFLS